jgi:hypothetical protein
MTKKLLPPGLVKKAVSKPTLGIGSAFVSANTGSLIIPLNPIFAGVISGSLAVGFIVNPQAFVTVSFDPNDVVPSQDDADVVEWAVHYRYDDTQVPKRHASLEIDWSVFTARTIKWSIVIP